jgi:dolichol-phosphate mannosyltransferase
MKISVVIPMYNEEENVLRTLTEVNSVMKDYNDYEILVIDDGSVDRTFGLAEEFASTNSNVYVFKQIVNMGMGKALRTGFEKARGNIIVTIDADLSYSAPQINILTSEMMNDETIDIVVGSQYMEGGAVKNIPFIRLFISKVANKFIGYSMTENLSTVTGVLRAYKQEVLQSMELQSKGTKINLEILSKANAIGFKIKEVPVVLEGRTLGQSKIKFRSKTISHILFSLYEKPMILFGVIGLFLFLIGIISGLYLFYQYLIGTLDPTRPLMIFMILMIISGIQILIFGFIATQISLLKREIFIIQKENKLLRKKLE